MGNNKITNIICCGYLFFLSNYLLHIIILNIAHMMTNKDINIRINTIRIFLARTILIYNKVLKIEIYSIIKLNYFTL